MPMSLVRLLFDPREHGRRGRLYRMYGTYNNYPPWRALLNVCLMIILRRTDCFILIWACSAVLTEPYNCHFSNCRSFRTKPEQNRNVNLSCAMLFLEKMPVQNRCSPFHTALCNLLDNQMTNQHIYFSSSIKSTFPFNLASPGLESALQLGSVP